MQANGVTAADAPARNSVRRVNIACAVASSLKSGKAEERRAGAAPTMPEGIARRCFNRRATALYLPRRFFFVLCKV